jgi:ribosome-binding protein aMBF1 (putative translation factor)
MRVALHDVVSLAGEVGVSDQCVREWLQGKYLPTNPKHRNLARALRVEEAELRRVITATRESTSASAATIETPESTTPVAGAEVQS